MSEKDYKIYILQMHTRTMPARLIKSFTNYKYSHIAISFDKSCETIYSFGRKKLNSIFNSGFIRENKMGPFFKKFSETICRIYELEVTKEQYENLQKIISEMEKSSEDYKYDFIGVVLRFFMIPISFKNKYVCSYFVADIIEKANIHKFNKKTFFITPKDFEEIKEMKEIYSGKYATYKYKLKIGEVN